MRPFVTLAAACLFVLTIHAHEGPPYRMIRGDANLDGILNLTDSLVVLAYLFQDGEICSHPADANDDGRVNLTDAVVILQYLFAFGDPFPGPFPCPGSSHAERVGQGGVTIDEDHPCSLSIRDVSPECTDRRKNGDP